MVNVIVVSKLLNEGEYFFNSREFPEAPKIDDYINILSFVKGENKKNLEEYFKTNNKTSIGRVNGRTWGYDEGKLSLFITLEYEDIIEEDVSNAAFYFPG